MPKDFLITSISIIKLTLWKTNIYKKMLQVTVHFNLCERLLKFDRYFFDRRFKMFQVKSNVTEDNLFDGFNTLLSYEVVSNYDNYVGYYHELYGGFYQGFFKFIFWFK